MIRVMLSGILKKLLIKLENRGVGFNRYAFLEDDEFFSQTLFGKAHSYVSTCRLGSAYS